MRIVAARCSDERRLRAALLARPGRWRKAAAEKSGIPPGAREPARAIEFGLASV
jgi:hypothetical protein